MPSREAVCTIFMMDFDMTGPECEPMTYLNAVMKHMRKRPKSMNEMRIVKLRDEAILIYPSYLALYLTKFANLIKHQCDMKLADMHNW